MKNLSSANHALFALGSNSAGVRFRWRLAALPAPLPQVVPLANGFTTTTVGDGHSAIDYALTGSFDLIVLDLGLPGKDGFTVLRLLRERGATMPVIILTARDTVRDTVAGLEGGADDYMTKPFRFEELLARVRLRLRSADRAPEATVLSGNGVLLDRPDRARVHPARTIPASPRPGALP